MRILLVCNYRPGAGGISGQVEILQRKLRDVGYGVDVFSTKAAAWKRLWIPVRLWVIAKEYDVLHIHCCSGWGFLPAVLGVSVGKLQKKRIVLTYHGGGAESFFDNHPRLVRKYLTCTDANIVLSGFLAGVFEKHHLPFTIIPNIIELNGFRFRFRESLMPHFICIRAHEELYNIPCVLRAFQRVQAEYANASLTLVGDGSLHDALVCQAQSLGIKNVLFTGRVDNSSIFEYLEQADVMLSAPTIDNMPVSLIEAMNAGLLVVSSEVGGVPYMVEHKRTGLLFPSDDDNAMAKQMLWALSHQEESLKIIKNARKEVANYSWEKVGEQIRALYE